MSFGISVWACSSVPILPFEHCFSQNFTFSLLPKVSPDISMGTGVSLCIFRLHGVA